MKRSKHLATIIAIIVGAIGVLIVLYAWSLPPFSATHPSTENAYVRGRVTNIAPQLSGYVASVEAQDFQQVERDQVIATLDDRQYRQRLAQAEAALSGAEAALRIGQQNVHSAEANQQSAGAALVGAQAGLGTAQQAWDRVSALQERGVAAQSAADQSQLSLSQATAQVAQAESAIAVARENTAGAKVSLLAKQADIESAKAAVELAQIDLDNTRIRAPQAGRLGQISARVGQFVTAGTTLASHVSPEVWVIANFRETELAQISVGDSVTFTVDAMRHRTFTGQVQSMSPATASEFSLLSASNATGNFTKVAQRLPIRIDIDPDQELAEHLAPGLSVVVTVK